MLKNYSSQQGNVVWYILAIVLIIIVGFFVWIGPGVKDSALQKTLDANRDADIYQIILAAELFAEDNQGQYPRVSGELSGPEYLVNGVPTDPETGESYSYTVSNDGTYVTVCATLSNKEQTCFTTKDEIDKLPGFSLAETTEIAEEINKTLPINVDSVTLLISVTGLENGYFYDHKISEKKTELPLDLFSSIQNNLCISPDTELFRVHDSINTYRYFDVDNILIGEFTVDFSEC